MNLERSKISPDGRQKLTTRIWRFINRSPTDIILGLPHGRKIVAMLWMGWHAEVIYCFVTGKMISDWGTIVEGRKGAPILYWTYMTFMIAGTIVIDAEMFRSYFRRKK